MSELSEKELLLLSNYLYMDNSVTQGTIAEVLDFYKNAAGYFEPERVQYEGIGGGMDVIEATELLEEMERAPDTFKNLEIVRVIDEGGIRGICFAERGGSDATVVFRGTGGEYHSWADNVYGKYMSETDMQRLAADFVRDQCGVYDDITVAGHSKGGNLAQYVTVVCPKKVDRCISYDGQGFGSSFFEKNEELVHLAAPKITSISACNDFVNILLTPIAGQRIFIENKGKGIYAHSSYWLLKSGEFDENGNFLNITHQSASMQGLERLASFLVERMERLPGSGDEVVSNLLAAIVAAVMSSDQSEKYEKAQFGRAMISGNIYLTEMLFHIGNHRHVPVKLNSQNVYLVAPKVKSAGFILKESTERIGYIAVKLEEVRAKRSYQLTGNYYTDGVLAKIINRLYESRKKTVVMHLVLEEIITLYEQKEIRLVGDIHV